MRQAFLIILLCVASCAAAQSFRTSVAPRDGEDLDQECRYEMTLARSTNEVRGLWVIYDRGPQVTSFYSDPDVAKLARRFGIGLVLAHHCKGKYAPGGPEEMDMDPRHGVGRALFTAIEQFASQSHHPELVSSKVILLGFSGTGALFAHFEEYAPRRVIAAILINAAQVHPLGLDTVELSSEGIEVPELIFAGGQDTVATTQAPYYYFRRYREQGAPWTFVVQNKSGHFGVKTTKPMVLAWLAEVLKQRRANANTPLRKISERNSWHAYFTRCPPEDQATKTWNICGALAVKARSAAPENMTSAGWFPSRHVAEVWLKLAQQPH